eukprot:s448_g44.t1
MPDATRSGMIGTAARQDPKETFVADAREEEPAESSSSSSDSDSSSDESHPDLILPNDPVAEKAHWDPDFEMHQHRAVGTQQDSFSCGVRMTTGFQTVYEVDVLVFRKCKRCTTAKPVKDVGAAASALKKRRARGLEVHLTEAEIDAVIASGVSSLARLAFAASPPGTTPTDEQVRGLFTGGLVPNVGTLASLKRLIFEAQTLVVADVKANFKVTRKEENIPTNMAPVERENRVAEQRKRLTGLRLRGEEEVGQNVYDLLLAMAEKDVLVYHGPEKFHTRRQELLNKKPGKELATDASSL